MRLPPRWARRLVLDPLWVVLGLALTVVLLLLAVLSSLILPLSRHRRLPRLCLLAAGYLLLDVALLTACAALWCRHPLRRQRPPSWVARHVAVLRWALNRLLALARRTIAYRITVEDQLPHDDDTPLVLLARHAGPGDSFSLVWLILERYRRCPRVVMKEALQWDPGLDVILNRLDSCFLPSRSGAGDDATELIAAATRSLRRGDALLLFPEGGNWTPRRQRRAVRRLRLTGHGRAAARAEAHPNVLPPRPAGTVACLQARTDLGTVVVAHTGLDRLVTARQTWEAIPLDATRMTIGLRRIDSAQVPRGSEDIPTWLDQQWADLSEWVAQRDALSQR